jgi:hypothetical protein
MENLKAGKMKLKIGLFIAIAICFKASLIFAESSAPRTLWYLSQNWEPSRPSFPLQSRYAVSANITHYSNSLNYQGTAQLGLGLFEIRGFGSQRQTLGLADLNQTVGFEIGRYYVSGDNNFGKLSIGYSIEPQSVQQYIYISLNTGILEKETFPWIILFKLQYAIFLPSRDFNVILSSIETSYGLGQFSNRFGNFLNLGVFLNWAYKQKVNPLAGLYENMLFGFGPLARLNTLAGTLDLKILFRFFIDQEIYNASPTTSTAYPSDFNGMPNFYLSWNYYF